MGRPINPKCWECSLLDSDTARHLHGEQGDGCWNEKICHRRRSHYRHRADNNQKRKGQYALTKPQPSSPIASTSAATIASPTVSTTIQPKVPPVAILHLYRERRQDAHLHAIGITIWQGDKKLEQIGPTHCIGMSNRHVRQYLLDILKVLEERYNIREFEPEIYIPPHFCPIVPCPLRPEGGRVGR